jgi:hypothetical protein
MGFSPKHNMRKWLKRIQHALEILAILFTFGIIYFGIDNYLTMLIFLVPIGMMGIAIIIHFKLLGEENER